MACLKDELYNIYLLARPPPGGRLGMFSAAMLLRTDTRSGTPDSPQFANSSIHKHKDTERALHTKTVLQYWTVYCSTLHVVNRAGTIQYTSSCHLKHSYATDWFQIFVLASLCTQNLRTVCGHLFHLNTDYRKKQKRNSSNNPKVCASYQAATILGMKCSTVILA